ncbi:FMN-dependent dehydrogenase [Xylariomycetidae sp. FL0641]|nr:FMN-dependent dehydrogenase [Xylariomycetidae sp. FL0641]
MAPDHSAQAQKDEKPDALKYEEQVYASGLHDAKPPFTFESWRWEGLAQGVLSRTSWGYVHGNAGQGSTCAKNLAAFSRYSIVPRRMRPSRRNADGKELISQTATTVLGQKLNYPLALAPVGVQNIFNHSGECGTARAAAAVGLPYIMSTASSTSIEEVAEANGPDSLRWFQLYWPPRTHDDITLSLLRRAKTSGFSALFVTLDTYTLGWRPYDMDNGYSPFLQADRIGTEVGFTDPVFREQFEKQHGYALEDAADSHAVEVEGGGRLSEANQEWSRIMFPGHSHSWEDLAFLRQHWDGPIVLKGIQTVADAKRAADAGCQGIVVSNHGGRQQDGGCASLAVLPRIVDTVGERLDVLFDSGVRCGADALKALALGAKCVLIGRPYIWGLAIGGEEGCKHVLRSLCGDVMLNMHLAGLRDLSEVTRDVIVKDDELF